MTGDGETIGTMYLKEADSTKLFNRLDMTVGMKESKLNPQVFKLDKMGNNRGI